MSFFTAYGECIESDLYFDALPRSETFNAPVRIEMERVGTIERDRGASLRPCIAQGRDVHIVSHESHVTVQIDTFLGFELWLSSNRIQCYALHEISDDTLKYWILQQMLPLFYLLKGSMEFLHGMAVSALPLGPDHPGTSSASPCIAFLGKSHAGKSTLLKYFLSRGHALVTDDHLALSRQDYTRVLPSTPFYRPYRAAEDLGVPAPSYSAAAARLQSLYLIEPAPPEAAPRLDKLIGMDAVTALFPNIHYSLHNPKDPHKFPLVPDFFPLIEDRFRGLADIARRVPIARLHIPRSLDRLPEVYDFISRELVS